MCVIKHTGAVRFRVTPENRTFFRKKANIGNRYRGSSLQSGEYFPFKPSISTTFRIVHVDPGQLPEYFLEEKNYLLHYQIADQNGDTIFFASTGPRALSIYFTSSNTSAEKIRAKPPRELFYPCISGSSSRVASAGKKRQCSPSKRFVLLHFPNRRLPVAKIQPDAM